MGRFKVEDTKWSVIRDAYNNSTAQVSNNIRTFALAGIGVIWLFKETSKIQGVPFQLDKQLLIATYFIIACLIVDLLQYLYLSIVWNIAKSTVYKSNPSPDDTDIFKVWSYINIPASFTYYLKTILLMIGYVIILCFLSESIVGA